MKDEFNYELSESMAPQDNLHKIIKKEILIPATLIDVWDAWTTSEGAKTFFAPAAKIKLAIGGEYELYFMPEAPEGSRGSEDCHLLSFVPYHMLSFEWNAPPSLPNIRKEHTWVVVLLEPVADKQVKITLYHQGWKDGEEWNKAFDYFTRAWDIVLSRLQYRFATQPIDWSGRIGVRS